MRSCATVVATFFAAFLSLDGFFESQTTPSLTGRVVNSETGAPVARAALTLRGGSDLKPITAVSDAEGKFSFPAAPPGRYELVATKPPYLLSVYGQTKPGAPGLPITLGPAAQPSPLIVRIWPSAVLAGSVIDEHGEPRYMSRVRAHRIRWSGGTWISEEAGSAVTDDLGAFRIHSLTPGRFVVSVSPGGGEPGARYAPIYYPSTSHMRTAQVLDLQAGQEQRLNLQVPNIVLASVQGVATGSGTLKGVRVSLVEKERSALSSDLGVYTGDDGKFLFDGVPPGHYQVRAIATSTTNGSVSQSWAVADVSVFGEGVSGIVLQLTPGNTIAGRVQIDALSASSKSVELVLTDLNHYSPERGVSRPRVPVTSEGVFMFTGIAPGRYHLGVRGDANLFIRSVTAGGAEMTDAPIVIENSTDLRSVQVQIGGRPGAIRGTLRAGSGGPPSNYLIVVFPEAEKLWHVNPQRMKSARPAPEGDFSITALPPGRYLVGAVADPGSDDWMTPDALKAIRQASTVVQVVEAETRTVDLAIR